MSRSIKRWLLPLWILFLLGCQTSSITAQPEIQFDYDPVTQWIVGVQLHGRTVVTIPASLGEDAPVKGIGPGAFAGKDLTAVTIEEGIEVIGDEAFARNALTELILPESIRHLGHLAFMDNQIKSVELYHIESEEIGEMPFRHNPLSQGRVLHYSEKERTEMKIMLGWPLNLIDHYETAGGFLIQKDSNILVGVRGPKTTEITLPEQLTYSIGSYPERPHTIAHVAPYAFYGYGLTKVTVPYTYLSIGRYAFAHNEITEFSFDSLASGMLFKEGALMDNRLTSVFLYFPIRFQENVFRDNPITQFEAMFDPLYYQGSETTMGLSESIFGVDDHTFDGPDEADLSIDNLDEVFLIADSPVQILLHEQRVPGNENASEYVISGIDVSQNPVVVVGSVTFRKTTKKLVNAIRGPGGDFVLIGYDMPSNWNGFTDLPLFVLKVKQDFSGYEMHELEHPRLRTYEDIAYNETTGQFAIVGRIHGQYEPEGRKIILFFDDQFEPIGEFELPYHLANRVWQMIPYHQAFALTVIWTQDGGTGQTTHYSLYVVDASGGFLESAAEEVHYTFNPDALFLDTSGNLVVVWNMDKSRLGITRYNPDLTVVDTFQTQRLAFTYGPLVFVCNHSVTLLHRNGGEIDLLYHFTTVDEAGDLIRIERARGSVENIRNELWIDSRDIGWSGYAGLHLAAYAYQAQHGS